MGMSAVVALVALGQAGAVSVGSYVCSVEQKASIASTHLEGAGPPLASTDTQAYRFRIVVAADAGRLRIVEAPYTGADASPYQWEDENSTLHAAYLGDGRAFAEEEGPGFLNFGRNRWGPGLQFYHAGYEYGGGEDQSLSVRWGSCLREQ